MVMSSQAGGNARASAEGMPRLTSYLSTIRDVALRKTTPTASTHHPTLLILGNPSADLDSCISAIVASYFYNLKTPGSEKISYIPVLNLPTIRSTDLSRLRPELGVAVKLATGGDVETNNVVAEQGRTSILDQLVTVGDIKATKDSAFHDLFNGFPTTDVQTKQPLFLVDHNVPSIPGLPDEQIAARFEVKACIDHHVDEDFVSKNAEPRNIVTGIGSCTTLVVKEVVAQKLWPMRAAVSASDLPALQELAKLALAPILIDTSNLRATGDKCSVWDQDAVQFLESFIKPVAGDTATTSSSDWDRDAFQHIISTAKSNSLDLLTMQEIFDRDYKVWTESFDTPGTGKVEVNIGISSLVKPLSWLIEHAGSVSSFVTEMHKFTKDGSRDLGIFCLLTRTGDGKKEVVVISLDDRLEDLIRDFEKKGKELQLERWDEVKNRDLFGEFRRIGFPEWRVWYMGDTSKSRKQVGPILRETVKLLGRS
jgi:exopolyphosphatase